jgi:hypothetical protein
MSCNLGNLPEGIASLSKIGQGLVSDVMGSCVYGLRASTKPPFPAGAEIDFVLYFQSDNS